eukprot:TRINITY_DN2537_c0_g1_i1.p1 TRINITY_DN2537_c0_g1~~TRINITY_DN2537_c0_g1_i1.p1  ORF type:complete len:423 (-),score=73.51 TRINITY_DN2537_c0_g1_i1:161-1429(-)
MAYISRKKQFAYCIAPVCLRFWLTWIIATFVAIVGILIYNSPPYPYSFGDVIINWNYNPITNGGFQPFDKNFQFNAIFEPHSHTIYSDGQLTPEQLIQFYIANGFNVLAVTDHNTIQGALEAQKIAQAKYSDKISIVIGEEWTNCRVHMGFLGITEEVPPIKYPTDDDIKNAISNVHKQGGIVIYNHIPWSYWAGLDQPTKEQLVDWGIDYFDITTESILDLQTLFWAQENGIGIIAGNDEHTGVPINEWSLVAVQGLPLYNYTQIGSVNLTVPSPSALVQTLSQNRGSTNFIFDAIGAPYAASSTMTSNPKYTFLTPWLLVGGVFHSFFSLRNSGPYSFVKGSCGDDHPVLTIYWTKIAASVGWFLFTFVLAETIRYGIGKLSHRFCVNAAYVLSHGEPSRKREEFTDEHSLTPLLDIWNK